MHRVGSLACVVALLAVSLGACSSIPDLTFDDEGSGVEGGVCKPGGPEICDDGIDNDCDGKTDCEDAKCGAFACVDLAPPDWSLVAFSDATALPACPSGFGAGRDLKSATGTGAASCACNCGTSTCANGNFSLAFGGAACAGAESPQTLAVRAACEKLPGNGFAVGANVSVRFTAPAAPACNAPTPPAPSPVKTSRVCAAPSRVGGGCQAGQVCAPRATPDYGVCVTKSGAATCPSAYPVGRRAGEAATDTRACSACSCTSTPCTGDVRLYDSVGCIGGESLRARSTTCTAQTNGAFSARAYTGVFTGGGCAVSTPSTPTGALTLTGESTVCCK